MEGWLEEVVAALAASTGSSSRSALSLAKEEFEVEEWRPLLAARDTGAGACGRDRECTVGEADPDPVASLNVVNLDVASS